MSFNELKRSRGGFDKLQSALEAESSEKKSYGDDRYWKPELDKSGNGYAVLRFLPAANGEELPWVQYWDHGFQGPGGWFIEKSLTTLGQNCPISEYNTTLWNSGDEAQKDQARKQKRRLHYVANVLVVSAPTHPENEGKVMLYRFGKKIFEKIKDVMQPQFEDENPINPFDMWECADFKLKIRNVEGYRNYDKSEFSSPSSLYDGDDSRLESVYNQLHNLSEFVDPSNYKTYDELKSKLMRVLGEEANAGVFTVKQDAQINEPVSTPEPQKLEPVTADQMDDEDDTMSYFAKFANEDD